MRLLIDEPISWLVAEQLRDAGFDAVHVRELGMQGAEDIAILERASAEQRIVVTQDNDFGTLLAQSKTGSVSVVLLRQRSGLPSHQFAALIHAVKQTEADLLKGAMVVVSDWNIRIRTLPFI